MILRTPPPKKRRADFRPPDSSPPSPAVAGGSGGGGPLVIFEDPSPSAMPESSPQPSDHMLCTYQCRQLVKAEFLDKYATMEKLISEYESKLETLNNNLQNAETEGKKCREQFLYAEQELAAAKAREKALHERVLNEINASQERLQKQLLLSNELEVKLQKESDARRSAESASASAEEKANLLERQLKHLSDSTEREKKKLNDELMHLKEDSNLSAIRTRADLERMQSQAHTAQKESELLEEKLEDISKQLKKCLEEKTELEKILMNFSSPKEDVSSCQNDSLMRQLQEELRNYESEVCEARRLKASHDNIELLKEKLLEEKERRERAEAELFKLSKNELNMQLLEDELVSWKKILKEIPGVSSSADIPLKFVTLQKEVIECMNKLGDANTRSKQLEVALETAQLNQKNAELNASLAKEKAESLDLEIKQLKFKLSSVKERDQSKGMVDDRTLIVETGNEAVNRNLVQELEYSLAQKETYIKELESNLDDQKAANVRHRSEMRMLNEKLNSEERRIKSLEREGDRLRSEIALLESKLGHGDFSASSTKVLRMVNVLGVDNEARQTIEALQNELRKADEKLKVVEELKKQSAGAGQLVDSNISGKIVQLKDQIATLEKREERYKTVFADRISVFRRACCELFGYKIVMDDQQRPNGIPVTRFTLQSIYAQSDDEKLEFEYESGNTKIMVNDYVKQSEISQQVEIFIRKMNSIPAFTANLTVESFNRRTLS